ncbi:hypothetical protein [Marinobacter sp. F4206]|uniref:hypothetical protein n=1 Tax=Marinobacter sp. F4206 TaxID=2861777 RepID=UPI001C5E2F0F|nr:hypothetical protein [Marinobacter sp. F4206]MBW4936363.1 hypothetical protein [Marinobacter sp. F4206]
MRADLTSRIVSAIRFIGLTLIALGLVACKTEKAADQPTILGIPPSTAYLGVEYYYNFGAYGGESILDYSLTNAPSWLALEDTSNKARQGVIMRGVPGLTGGNRGDQDLGKEQDINLVTTDGRMSGVQPFDIEVKYNPLSLEVETFTEGESPEVADTRRERCDPPDLEPAGEHSFTINQYDEDGNVTGTKDVTSPTRPVFAKVILDRPSVTRVSVAFEVTSEYDPSDCDSGFDDPHQRCDYSEANVGDANVGQDIVALGSNSEARLEELEYLTYREDGLGGLLTLEPGVTECYIRLEVIDDTFPEPSEVARLTLTEVRNGLAGLGENNEGTEINLVIDDDEPVLTLETTAGGTRDALNINGMRQYVGILSGDREGAFRARLRHSEDSTARLGSEFVIEQEQSEGVWIENDELVFPEAVDELRFRIRVLTDTYTNTGLNDRFILLGLDEAYQAGRENYARVSDENLLRVSLNELTSALVLNGSDGFVATDFAIAHSGRAFVTGYDSLANNRVLVKIYDQKGNLLQDIGISEAGDVLDSPEPVIGTVLRKVSEGAVKVDRFEFAVAYSSDVPGAEAKGGQDVVVSRYWFDTATAGGAYVNSWSIRTGTSGDDIARSVGINAEGGYVSVAGETTGTWPDQERAGAVDSFLQRIDTRLDGEDEIPVLAWTRQIGSSADDSVAGGSSVSIAPLLFGSAAGAVNGKPVLGGTDAFFYSVSSAESTVSVKQVGTDADEPISDGVYENNLLWLVGTGTGEYSVKESDEGDSTLARNPVNSWAGFVFAYSSGGVLNRAFSVNDEDDMSLDRFEAVSLFDGDVVVGGATDGKFRADATPGTGEQAILARVSLIEVDENAEETPFRNQWHYQLPADDSELLALANYRDDEIVALARGDSDWLLLVFSPEGRLLSALN